MMVRRLMALILALILTVMLCELHICPGEGCLFCALLGELRDSLTAVENLCAFRILPSVLIIPCFFAIGGIARRHSLIDLKVKLTD